MRNLAYKPEVRPEVSSDRNTSHRAFYKLGAAAIMAAGIAFTAPVVLPKIASAQGQEQTQKETIPLESVKKYVDNAERYKNETGDSYRVVLSDSTHVLFAFSDKKNDLQISELRDVIDVTIFRPNQKPKIYQINPKNLRDAYLKFSGQQLKYARVGIETGTDSDVGEYVQFFVIPVAKKDGEIVSGTPVAIGHCATKLDGPAFGPATTGGEPLYVASR